MIVAYASYFHNHITPGAGYVFSGTGAVWNQIAELTSSNRGSVDSFGDGLEFNGNTVVLNQLTENSPALGTAYVFVEPQGGWASMTETAQLKASVPTGSIFAAGTISPNGNTILGTATLNTSGTVYAFDRPRIGWATTSTPNFDLNIEYTLGSIDIGAPNIAAVSAATMQAGMVLLYQQ